MHCYFYQESNKEAVFFLSEIGGFSKILGILYPESLQSMNIYTSGTQNL